MDEKMLRYRYTCCLLQSNFSFNLNKQHKMKYRSFKQECLVNHAEKCRHWKHRQKISIYSIYWWPFLVSACSVHARGWAGRGAHGGAGAGDLALRWRPHGVRVAARPRLLELHGRVLGCERGGGRHQPRDLAGGRLAGGAALRGHHTNTIVHTIV